jgi:hypothetical protein
MIKNTEVGERKWLNVFNALLVATRVFMLRLIEVTKL